MSHIFHYFKNLPNISLQLNKCLPTNKCFPSINCFPYNKCTPSNICTYHPEPKALMPPEFAGAGPSSNPGVAAPTKGVVSC